VDNTLTGEGKLGVDLTFSTIEDFSPGAVARNVEPLAKLLEARTQLEDLLSYMDGKNGAQDLLDKVMKDPTLLAALSSAKRNSEQTDKGEADGGTAA
jgi:type VI secretion system protein ImpB